VPVSEVIRRCQDVRTVAEVLQVVGSSMACVWITKAENAHLTHLGYQSKRPDPVAAYEHATIHVDPWPLG